MLGNYSKYRLDCLSGQVRAAWCLDRDGAERPPVHRATNSGHYILLAVCSSCILAGAIVSA